MRAAVPVNHQTLGGRHHRTSTHEARRSMESLRYAIKPPSSFFFHSYRAVNCSAGLPPYPHHDWALERSWEHLEDPCKLQKISVPLPVDSSALFAHLPRSTLMGLPSVTGCRTHHQWLWERTSAHPCRTRQPAGSSKALASLHLFAFRVADIAFFGIHCHFMPARP